MSEPGRRPDRYETDRRATAAWSRESSVPTGVEPSSRFVGD